MPKITPEQAEQIRAARLAAAVKKVKEGKSLTLGEQRLIDSMTEPDRADTATWPNWVSSIAQAAAIMGVPKSTLRAAKAQGCPAFRHSRVSPKMALEWIESRKSSGTTAQESPVDGTPAVTRSLGKEIEDLSTLLAQVDAQASRAFASGETERGCNLIDQSKAISERRKNAQVELRRQGKTEDDSITRTEFERLAFALAHHAIVAVQRLAAEAVSKLEGIDTPAERLRVLLGILTPAAYLRPFELASGLEAGHGLPPWCGEAMLKAARENLE
jgi:hypothetical protein